MRKIGDLIISDKTEDAMIDCVEKYSIYSYYYGGNGIMYVTVYNPKLLNLAIDAQDYLNEVCPEFKWFAGIDDWIIGPKLIFCNCSW